MYIKKVSPINNYSFKIKIKLHNRVCLVKFKYFLFITETFSNFDINSGYLLLAYCAVLTLSYAYKLIIKSLMPFFFLLFKQKSDVPLHMQTKSSCICMTDLSKESYEKNSFDNRYEPELSIVQNPYYYHVNEVLFQAHVQRLQRSSRVMS